MVTKKKVNDLSYKIIGYAIDIHKELGPGLLESVYEACFVHLLQKNGHSVKQQNNVKINFKGLELETNLRYDILVDDLIIIELKTVTDIHPVYHAQILSYMMMLKVPKGILINFFCENLFRQGQITFVNKYFSQLPDGE